MPSIHMSACVAQLVADAPADALHNLTLTRKNEEKNKVHALRHHDKSLCTQ